MRGLKWGRVEMSVEKQWGSEKEGVQVVSYTKNICEEYVRRGVAQKPGGGGGNVRGREAMWLLVWWGADLRRRVKRAGPVEERGRR